MTLDQQIALGASLSASLTAIATFMTVLEMKRQREASYRPDLKLARSTFVGIAPDAPNKLPSKWQKKPDDPPIEWLEVPIHNLGLRAARDVTLYWSCDIERIVRDVNDFATRAEADFRFQYDSPLLTVHSKKYSNHASHWKNQQSASIDYILPAAPDVESTIIRLPFAYAQLLSAYCFFGTQSPNNMSFDIPPLMLTIEYLDAVSEKHSLVVDVAIHITAISAGTIMFGYIESTPAKIKTLVI